MSYLITYRCSSSSYKELLAYTIADDPFEWLLSTQKYKDETYFIVNVLPITKKQAKEYNGALRGM